MFMAQRLGLYGGSFNPIHGGHLIVARAIAERLDLERLVFLPSARPPHKDGETLAAPAHRAEMVRLAIEGEPVFELSDFDLTREGPSYTIDTAAHFRELHGSDAALHWIIGADSLAELTTWHRVGALVDTCRIITAARPGRHCSESSGTRERIDWNQLRTALSEAQIAGLKADVLETPVIEISSTDVRKRIRQGKSIRYLVPDRVRTYIEEHGLYRSDAVR